MKNTKRERAKNRFVEEIKVVFEFKNKDRGERQTDGANIACGRRDGGMIFNSNVLEVAPPHTRVLARKEKVIMEPTQKPYKPGRWVALGAALGTFIGLLFGKLALGMIFGFFLGIAIDSSKRKAASVSKESQSDKETKA